MTRIPTLSPKGRGSMTGIPTLAPLGERVPGERGPVRGFIRHSIMRDSVRCRTSADSPIFVRLRETEALPELNKSI